MNLEKIINSAKRIAVGSLLVGTLIFGCSPGDVQAKNNQSTDKSQKIVKKYDGFCYGPFREKEDPDKGVCPTTQELKEDISFLSRFTERIRTYGNTSTLSEIPVICQKQGLDCYVGAWLGEQKIENEKEISNLIQIANSNYESVKGLIVGNEVLFREDLSKGELSDYIRRVNEATDIPVGTAETHSVLLNNRDIAKNCDFLLVHIHPYWEGVDIKNAAEQVVKQYNMVKEAFPDTKVIIGETGWPSMGRGVRDAVPNAENQKAFFQEFTRLAEQNSIPYFYFEVFDEGWKHKFEGEAGAHWGIFNSDGSLKPLFESSFPEEIRKGIKRPAGTVKKILVKAPVIVYNDGGSEDNHFQPTGYMGDLESITVERDCKEQPYSGETCTKIVYKQTTFSSWAGVYWQYPINNWGDYPGYDISGGASKLIFYARGKDGSERAEFKVGGVNRAPYKDRDKPYEDSFGPVTTGVIKLTENWKQYEIDLKKQNLDNVIGGFCWVTNRSQNPKGCTIYLDDISFE